MTVKLTGVLGLVLCAACNPFAVEAVDPGGTGAAPSGGQVMGSSVMQDVPLRPVPSRSMSKTSTGTATSPVITAAPTTPPADGAQQSPDGPPAAASGAAEASAPAMTTTPAAGAAPPADSSAMSAGSTPAEGTSPTTPTTPAEGSAPAEGSEGAAGTTDTGMTATMEDPSGRSKGTAPKGTPVPEGGMECMNEVCLPLPPLNEMAMSMGFMLSLCCTPEGECGTLANDMPCRVIPDSDPQCPRLDVMGFEIASCCTEDGKCGLNGEALMQKPCGSLEEAIMMFGQFIEFPEPRACAPKASAPAGGMPDAGAMTP